MRKITPAQWCGLAALVAIAAACVLASSEAMLARGHVLAVLLVVFCAALPAFAILEAADQMLRLRRASRCDHDDPPTDCRGIRIEVTDRPR